MRGSQDNRRKTFECPALAYKPPSVSNNLSRLSSRVDDNTQINLLNQDHVTWKLKPWLKHSCAPSAGRIEKSMTAIRNVPEKVVFKLSSNLIRLDCLLRKQKVPKILCPKGGRAVLEAYVKKERGINAVLGRKQKVARFGITTQRGPPSADIIAAIQSTYNKSFEDPGVAAIIYMFVEPEFRSRGLGKLALEVISSIHATQLCDFTVLVADDNGSGKLVKWYKNNGFSTAELLQDSLGSPAGVNGIAMIRYTRVANDFMERCEISWW